MNDVPDPSDPDAKSSLAQYSLFDEVDDESMNTSVDTAFWNQPKIPNYPAVATFGRFEILGLLARGGMAEIYLARESADDGAVRHLVVKRVLPEMADHPELMQMFLDEGRMATRLYHPNICHVYETGDIDGTSFMTLEWVHGPTVLEMIERGGERSRPMPWPVAAQIAMEVASGLHYVHHATGVDGQPLNIVHRDVSPHNVMLSWSGSVKLLDFGIAKTSSAEEKNATTGKYGYLSPEQAQSRPVDSRSDVFSLGIVLFESLSGESLYDRNTLLDSLSAIVREDPPSIRALRPEVPEELEKVLHRALAKDPAARFQSAGEMQIALQQCLKVSGQTVLDKRIALYLDGVFSRQDKKPLGPQSGQVTGTFQALSPDMINAALQEQVTYQTFNHSSSTEIPLSGQMPLGSLPPESAFPGAIKSQRRARLAWLAIGGGGALAFGAGVTFAFQVLGI